MAFNGLGVFLLDFSWPNDAANGIPITASRVQAEDQNVADGLSNVICRDGQSTTTASIPFASGITTDTVGPVTAMGPISIPGGQLKFPATQNPSSNANTLDDYEEGAWTPADSSGSGLSFTVISALYTKIGRVVTLQAIFSYPSTGSGAACLIVGVPFSATTNSFASAYVNTDSGINFCARLNPSIGAIQFLDNTNTSLVNSNLSGKLVSFTITYFAAA